ncbi:MAG: PAS domain S-box protein [Pirellula sp.]
MSTGIEKRKPLFELNVELLTDALQSSAEAILIKDANGTILVGSKRVADFYSCDVNELAGRDAYSELPAELAELVAERDRFVLSTGNAELTEETWDLGYEQRTLLASRSPIRNKKGAIIGILTSYRNISPIKQAYLLFEQNQQRFITLAHTCPVGIFECNPYHQITYVNPEWERITGIKSDDAIGKEWTSFVVLEHLHIVQPLVGNADCQPAGDRVDCKLIGNHECMVELSLNHVSNHNNHTVSYIGSVVDLTYRLAVQEQLREKATLMRDLTSSVPAIIWQLSRDGRCVFASDYWEAITGKSIDWALGNNWEAFIYPEDLPPVKSKLASVLTEQKQSASFEYRIKGRDGDWRWLLASCQQIHTLEGKFLGIAGHAIDITDRRQAELELQRANALLEERVAERTQELSKANESLLAEMETRRHAEEMLGEKRSQLDHFSRISVMGRLSGELAHELNQPLNAIQNYVGSLEKIVSTSEVSEAANNILNHLNKEITRAAKIIRRTREFVSTGLHQSEPLSLSDLVTDTVAMLKGEARRRKISVQVDDRLEKILFMGDPVRLQQVLVNLVINGFESMMDLPESMRIARIELQNSPNRVTIAVHDSGCGVPESERERLFDAFFTTKATGLGMGLAISRGIVEDHGGSLTYQPREGGGSTFLIELPL